MPARRSSGGTLLTDFVLKVFRLNGELLEVAERITEGSGLTAARWQVLGAVLHAPLSVAGVARNMGLARQSVQRLADVLVEDGLCVYQSNPAHRRAKLLAPTARGRAAIEHIRPLQAAWANQVAARVGKERLHTVNAALDVILAALGTATAGEATRSIPSS
jgi:DNA-binding MarR family transcriptional regulator